MDFLDYKLSLQLRIDWSELDTYQHVNNVAFMKYLQSGRVNFWEASGLYKLHTETNRGPMLVSSHCDFRKPLFYPGKIWVKTKIAFIKNTSFGLDHLILNEHEEICAEGHDVAVCFDFNTHKTFRIPDDIREIMRKF